MSPEGAALTGGPYGNERGKNRGRLIGSTSLVIPKVKGRIRGRVGARPLAVDILM